MWWKDMSYSNWTTERIKSTIASDERTVNLIWESEHGQLLKWESPAGEMSGKIDVVEGLMSRIRTLRQVLKDRNIYMYVDLDEVFRKCKSSEPRHMFAKMLITRNYDGKIGSWAICRDCLDNALVIEKHANDPVIPTGIPFTLKRKEE